MTFRLACAGDSDALRQIYAQYIDTPVTFECSLPSRQEFAARVSGILEHYPYLVCEEQGRLAGYAYAHRQMEREAYQWNAELSIYLHWEFVSRGLGRRLYSTLMELLRLQEIHTVYGGVTLPNEPSERLHRSLGFQCAGVYRNTGYKCGAWHDVAWFEKRLLPPSAGKPAPVRPLREVPAQAVSDVLAGDFSEYSHR